MTAHLPFSQCDHGVRALADCPQCEPRCILRHRISDNVGGCDDCQRLRDKVAVRFLGVTTVCRTVFDEHDDFSSLE